MKLTGRRAVRWAGAVVISMATVPLMATTASAATGPPRHATGHGWASVQVCDPAGTAPYKYKIKVRRVSSIEDDWGYVAFANGTYRYYPFKHGKFTVKDAPAKPIEVGGLHYAKGHKGDVLSATVVAGPSCATG